MSFLTNPILLDKMKSEQCHLNVRKESALQAQSLLRLVCKWICYATPLMNFQEIHPLLQFPSFSNLQLF